MIRNKEKVGKITAEYFDNLGFTLMFYTFESALESPEAVSYGLQIDKLNSDESEILKSDFAYNIAASKDEARQIARVMIEDLF